MKKKNVILLTTKTSHHFFFINELSKICNLFIIFENSYFKPSYKIKHQYEKEQIFYEKKKWFKNSKVGIDKNLKILNTKNINSIKVIDFIKLNKPDVIFSFGISRLRKKFLNNIQKPIYNFHGGDTAYYRGLDSHLWSLYHNDIRGLKVTLHEVSAKLDTGDVISKHKLELKGINKLYKMRAKNTELCVNMAEKFIKFSKIKKIKQKKHGRYYSSMPFDLKNIINNKFKIKINKIYNDHK